MSTKTFLALFLTCVKKETAIITVSFVPAEGFKPPTLGAEIRCAIQLRHAGIVVQKYY